MQHTLAAVFDNRTSAQQAMDELVRCGFPKEDLALKDASSAGTTTGAGTLSAEGEQEESFGQSVKHFFSDLFGSGHSDTHVYTEAVKRGNTVLTYATDDQDRVERAADIIEGYGPVDIDEYESQWRASGWSGAEAARSSTYQAGAGSSLQGAQQGNLQGTASGSQQSGLAGGSQQSGLAGGSQQSGLAGGSIQRGTEGRPIPVMKEEIKVGKRNVQTGGVRVYSRLVETPVEEDISLREEHVNVQRRPVDRPIDPSEVAAFREASFEVRESAEEAVVEKSARVVEEVVVDKQVSERTKHISDKVRHTEVEVENLGAGAAGLASADEDSYYRSHWTSSLAGQGKYEDFEPAYRYGSTKASSQMYRNRPWDEAEPELRSDWERSNPGSAWERAKAAVRHGWDRITSGDEDTYYRSHWNSNYASAGGSYDDYAPAYRYGSTMHSNASYSARNWDDVEPELRSDWERSHPGSAWDRVKAAVRHGWDRMTSDDDSAYRSHYASTYGSRGGSYDEYAPAYRYGSSMRSDASYKGRQWDEVEPQLRSDWETRYPGSAWDRFKAAVRHGWDRITS